MGPRLSLPDSRWRRSIRPLKNLSPSNAAGIAEPRTRIELESRTRKLSWEEAANSFAYDQFNFMLAHNYVPELKRRA